MTSKHEEGESGESSEVRELGALFARMGAELVLDQVKVESAAAERDRLTGEARRLAERRDEHEREATAALESGDDLAARRAIGQMLPLQRSLRELELREKGAARHHEALLVATSERKRTLADLRGRLDRHTARVIVSEGAPALPGASDPEIELELLRRKRRHAAG